MNDALDEKLMEIESRLRDLSPEERNKILDILQTTRKKAQRIKKAVEDLQSSLDTLRVNIKYMVFDLECTRRENVNLQEQVTQLQRALEGHGHYAEEGVELIDDGDQLPEDEGGLIDLPDIGDFIHNSECDHPYDTNCWCEYCEACRIRMQQHGNGAD